MLNDAKNTSNPEKQGTVFGLFGLLIPFNFFSVSGSYWVFCLFACCLIGRLLKMPVTSQTKGISPEQNPRLSCLVPVFLLA